MENFFSHTYRLFIITIVLNSHLPTRRIEEEMKTFFTLVAFLAASITASAAETVLYVLPEGGTFWDAYASSEVCVEEFGSTPDYFRAFTAQITHANGSAVADPNNVEPGHYNIPACAGDPKQATIDRLTEENVFLMGELRAMHDSIRTAEARMAAQIDSLQAVIEAQEAAARRAKWLLPLCVILAVLSVGVLARSFWDKKKERDNDKAVQDWMLYQRAAVIGPIPDGYHDPFHPENESIAYPRDPERSRSENYIRPVGNGVLLGIRLDSFLTKAPGPDKDAYAKAFGLRRNLEGSPDKVRASGGGSVQI